MAKDEFVEVNLKLGLAHSVVGADQPLLEVANGSVGKPDSGPRAFAPLCSATLVASDVFKAGLREAGEAFETVRIDRGSRCDVLDKERNYRGGLEVRNHFHPDSTGSFPTLFDSDQDKSGSAVLELPAPSETGLFPANPRVINLYLTVRRFPSRIHHRPTKFVKHHPGSLVTRKTELTLQQQCGHSTLVSSHQVGCPEPAGQRSLRPDRKSTRLNSSHLGISYAGVCLKKNKRRGAAAGRGTKTTVYGHAGGARARQ